MPKQAYLVVGQVSRPHGVAGEIKARSWTDHPARLENIPVVYLQQGEHYQPYKVRRCRARGEVIYWQLEGVDTPEAVDRLRGVTICVARADGAPLAEGEYYMADLIGCQVVDRDNSPIGELKYIFRTGANDVYEIARADGSLCYLPVIRQVLLGVDLDADIITVDASMLTQAETIRE